MKVSLNWLTDYVDVAMPAKELADLLMRLGFCCEEIIETDTDLVLDVEVTSNRPDLFGHLGMARELAVATGKEFKPPAIGELPTSGNVADLAAVTVLEPALCPRYTARVIRNVKVGPSPRWLIERLEAVGMRSVNNVVDVTNFVLMEYSQPLHSFDYDKLAGRQIVVRRGKPGEVMVSIDETECKLDENMLVIADADKAVAVAGVMGGLSTEVTEGTTNLLIEAAQFDPLTTRRTSRKLQLMSESNYRFERGVDPVAVDAASLRACQLILDLAGGELAGGIIDCWATPHEALELALRPARCCKLLGLEIPAERQETYLAGLGLSPRVEGERIVCTIPPYRADLRREADLIEEVARLEGYDAIPTGGTVTHAVQPEPINEKTRRRLGEALNAAGFDETVTPAFLDPDEGTWFGFEKPVCVDPLIRRTNNALRPTLLPSLLRVCRANQAAGTADVDLFELASVFVPTSEPLPEQHTELAMLTTRDLRALRGAIEAVVSRVVPDSSVQVQPADLPGLAAGTAGRIAVDGQDCGTLGLLATNVRDAYDIERPCAAATLWFEPLLAGAGRIRVYQPVPKFPPVKRDLSLVVPEPTAWRQVAEAIDAVDQTMRSDVQYVTTYRGKPIDADKKSVTVTLTYRSDEGTLRGEDVDAQVQQIVDALAETLDATLRT